MSSAIRSAEPRAAASRLGILVVAIALVAPATAQAQAFTLGVRVDQNMGLNPTAVVAADLNGDGKSDLVTTANGSNQIAVRLGDGVGGFGAVRFFATGTGPYGLAVADLNRDGRPDAVTTNIGGNTISVLLGDGAGGFGPKTDLAAGSTPYWVAVGDLNADGRPDLAVANQGADNVSVLLGNGNGTFAPRVDYPTGGASYPVAVAFGELNGDGKADVVVVASGLGAVSRFLGNGDGTLGSKADFATANGPFSVAIGDVNADGRADLAVSSFSDAVVSVLLASGAPGSFGAKTDYAVTPQSQSVILTDLDGDHLADLAATGATGSMVTVWRGDGVGGFGSRADFAVGSYPVAVVGEDVNGDGRRDLVVANFNGASVTVLFGHGAGLHAASVDYPMVGSYPPRHSVAIGDLNHDGYPDLAASGFGTTVSVRLGVGAGVFGPRTDFAHADQLVAVSIAELNSDGHPDLVAIGQALAHVSVRLGNGAGGFAPAVGYQTGSIPHDLAVGDLNRDGRLDVVVPNNLAFGVSVSLGDGAGGFGPRTMYSGADGAHGVALGDFNGDGHLDAAVPLYNASGSVAVFPGNGTGGFGAATSMPTGAAAANGAAVGDLNGDGKLDLAVSNEGIPGTDVHLSYWFGDGVGGFGPRLDLPAGRNGGDVEIADVNGDGRLDLITTRQLDNLTHFWLGDGAGGLGPRFDLATASNPARLAVADVNGDGRKDLAMTCASAVSVILSLEPTRTALATAPAPAVIGAPITFTATVSAVAPGPGTPTGTVSFFDGTTLLGTSPVGVGVAALALFAPRLGDRAISAVYNGDTRYSGSFSAPRTQRVVSTGGASLTSILDVKNDQGRQVRLTFAASPFDYLGSLTPITSYHVYRQIGPLAAPGALAPHLTAAPAHAQFAGWDFLATVPATADGPYEVVATTLADSNASGFHRATFLVRAATATIGVFHDSGPDSGYSVDNLPPAPPAPFTGAYAAGAVHLHWGESAEPDFWHYRIYRGSSAGFVPGPGNLIATRSDTGYVDPGAAGSFYKLSAVDVNGNESGFALLTPAGTLGVGGDGQLAFALSGVHPNPARGDRLNVVFSLDGDRPTRLELYDVAGRQVAARDVGALGAGRHTLDLAEGRRLSAGVYLLRLSQDRRAVTRRAVVSE